MAPPPLPSLRRIVFGNAWYDRCAKESPSITSNGALGTFGFAALAAWGQPGRPALSAGSVAPSDSRKRVGAAGALVFREGAVRRRVGLRSLAHTGASSSKSRALVGVHVLSLAFMRSGGMEK